MLNSMSENTDASEKASSVNVEHGTCTKYSPQPNCREGGLLSRGGGGVVFYYKSIDWGC